MISNKERKRRDYLLSKVWHCVATKEEIKEFKKLNKKMLDKSN